MGKHKRSIQAADAEDIPVSKKVKAEADEVAGEENGADTVPYEERVRHINPIACPLASRKQTKKLYKLIRKASQEKGSLTSGLKNVQRALRRKQTGVMILAGDIFPVDIYCHIPIICEKQGIPYMFAPSRKDMGKALGFKRSVMLAFIHASPDMEKLYAECQEIMSDAYKREVLALM